jgi:hypothetical protein
LFFFLNSKIPVSVANINGNKNPISVLVFMWFQFWFKNQFQKLNLIPVWFLLTGTRDFNWPNGVLLAQQWFKPVLVQYLSMHRASILISILAID